jgi:hypothetical protein
LGVTLGRRQRFIVMNLRRLAGRRKNDINTDIDDNDCIMV